MKVRKSLCNIMEETEKSSIERAEAISRLILKKLEKMIGLSLEMDKEINSITFMISLLVDSSFPYQFQLRKLLEKHQVNERNLLLYLTMSLYSVIPGSNSEKQQIASLLSLPYIESILSKGNHYIVKSKYGTIEMFALEDWLNDHRICFAPKRFNGFCHYAVEALAPLLPDEYITTSEFKNLFGGVYYHSYYTLKDGGIVDPSRNLFYPGTCFEEVFKPKVVVQYPASELQERYQKLKKSMDQKDLVTLDPVCALAMDQKRKVLK
jgi:hypothetical protein